MPNLTIKSVPEGLLEALRESASAHRRSLNSEVLHRLERSVGTTRMEPDALAARISALHQRIRMSPLTDELLEKAKREGRP